MSSTLLVIRNARLSWGTVLYYIPILTLPIWAVVSTSWSDAPDVTLRLSLELLATVVFALVVARRISGRGFASIMMLAAIPPCAISLAVQPNAFHGIDLHGIFGSKNYFAFTTQLLIASALAVALDSTQPRFLRVLALPALPLGAVGVVLAHSAGAMLTSVISSLAFIAFTLMHRLPLWGRIILVVTAVLLLAASTLAWNEIVAAAQNFQVNVLHKNQTLTGRTGFWTFSQSLIAEKPILGHGYSAFWRQGNLDAEGLWEAYGIKERAGINFHNQFIETQVDLGNVGLGYFIVFISSIFLLSAWRVLRYPTPSSALMTSLLVALYSRLPVESSLIGQWTIFTLALVVVAVHSTSPLEFSDAGETPVVTRKSRNP